MQTKSVFPRVLLLQIRDEVRVRKEELSSFIQYSGLPSEHIDSLNVFETQCFDEGVLTGYDALFVGGASEASVLEPENYPFVESCVELLRHCVSIGFPVFASCFGFQLAVLALDGEIIRDQKDFEMGTIPISLTEAANADPLLHDVPDGFLAIAVHRERAPTLPVGCQLLAYTDSCAHIFKVDGKPFWAFQFHPEVDKATLVQRLTIYKDHYTDGDDHLEEVLREAQETPYSNNLVGSFVERVLMKRSPC